MYKLTNVPELNKILQSLYLEYRNDYLTVEKIAEHKNIDVEFMREIIRVGHQIHEGNVEANKAAILAYEPTRLSITYEPMHLSWCTSYEEEVKEFRELIEGKPADIGQLKNEYYQLTGKVYRKGKA